MRFEKSPVLIESSLSYAQVAVAAAYKRGTIPESADRTPEWLVAALEDAGRTLQALPARGTRPAQYGSGWPDVVHAAEVAYGWTADRVRPPAPSAADIERMDVAYGWIGLIPEGKRVLRRIVLMRSLVDPITDRHIWSLEGFLKSLAQPRNLLRDGTERVFQSCYTRCDIVPYF